MASLHEERWEVWVIPAFRRRFGARIRRAPGARSVTLEQIPKDVKPQEVETGLEPWRQVLSGPQADELLDGLRAMRLGSLPEDRAYGIDGVSWTVTHAHLGRTVERTRWCPGPGLFLEIATRVLSAVGLTEGGPQLSRALREALNRVEGLRTEREAARLDTLVDLSLLDTRCRELEVQLERVRIRCSPESFALLGLRPEEIAADRACCERLLEQVRRDPALFDGLGPDDPETAYVLKHFAHLSPALRALTNQTEALRRDAAHLARARTQRALSVQVERLDLGPFECALSLAPLRARIAQRILEEHPGQVVQTRCPRCGGLAARPHGYRCEACGHDWRPPVAELSEHECPHHHGRLEPWDGELRCWTCGWPEAGHLPDCPHGHGALDVEDRPGRQPACARCGWPTRDRGLGVGN